MTGQGSRRFLTNRASVLLAALALTACTGGAPSPTPSPTFVASASASLVSSGLGASEAAKAYLVPIPGYGYAALTPAVEQQTIAALQTAEVRQSFLGYAMASVTKDQVAQAVVVVFDAGPIYLATGGAMESFVAAMTGLTHTSATVVTLVDDAGGAMGNAYQLTSATQQMVVGRDDPFIIVVVGADLATVTAIASALFQQHG